MRKTFRFICVSFTSHNVYSTFKSQHKCQHYKFRRNLNSEVKGSSFKENLDKELFSSDPTIYPVETAKQKTIAVLDELKEKVDNKEDPKSILTDQQLYLQR